MKFYDAHIYYDDLRTDFNQLENLNKKYQCEFIISPQCTIQSEPEKSNLMYFLQPYLLSNKFLYYIAMVISKTFYKQNKLKFFWKIFTGFKNYHKIIIPNNNDVLNIIEKYHFIKSWLWINPTEKDSLKEFESFGDWIDGEWEMLDHMYQSYTAEGYIKPSNGYVDLLKFFDFCYS